MQNNKVNQEDEEPKSLIKMFIDLVDEREQLAGQPTISFMLGLLLLEFVGFGLYIMLLTCSWQTILK